MAVLGANSERCFDKLCMTDQQAGPVRLRRDSLEVPALLAEAGSIPGLGFLDPTSLFRFRSTSYAGRVRLRRAGVKADPARRGKFPSWSVVPAGRAGRDNSRRCFPSVRLGTGYSLWEDDP